MSRKNISHILSIFDLQSCKEVLINSKKVYEKYYHGCVIFWVLQTPKYFY